MTKGRPRFANGKTYTPKTTKDAENEMRWVIKRKYPGLQPDPHALFKIEAFFSQSTFQRRDLDNMIKLVSDACNQLVWVDDAQVVEIAARLSRGQAAGYSEITISRVAELGEQEEEHAP